MIQYNEVNDDVIKKLEDQFEKMIVNAESVNKAEIPADILDKIKPVIELGMFSVQLYVLYKNKYTLSECERVNSLKLIETQTKTIESLVKALELLNKKE